MSRGSYPPYSPPEDFNSNASRSSWSPDSQTGSGYDSVNLPPIDDAAPGFDLHFEEEVAQFFDSLPRLSSPSDPFRSEPSSSRSQEQPTLSNPQARTTIQREPSQYNFIRYSES